jgi:hypothetical protein
MSSQRAIGDDEKVPVFPWGVPRYTGTPRSDLTKVDLEMTDSSSERCGLTRPVPSLTVPAPTLPRLGVLVPNPTQRPSHLTGNMWATPQRAYGHDDVQREHQIAEYGEHRQKQPEHDHNHVPGKPRRQPLGEQPYV